MTSQTDFIGTVFIADPTNSTQQLKVNADGSINAVVSSFGTASAGNGLVVTGGAIGISPTTGPAQSENRVINGDFLIDQYNEFASFTPVNTGYGPDRWRWGLTVAGSLTGQVLTASPPSDMSNYLTITVANAQTISAASSYALLYRVEGLNIADLGFGTSSAKGIVVSFWAQASIAGPYSFSLNNSGSTRTYVTTYTVATPNTWALYSFVIPGDIAGTWLTTRGTQGLGLRFDLGSGSNSVNPTGNAWTANTAQLVLAGTTQLILTASATLSVSGVRVYASPYVLPYSPRQYGLELELAQRYYRKSFPAGTAPAQSAGVTGAICVKNPIALGDPSVYVAFAPQMMAAPTIVTFNPSAANANWRDTTAAADVTVSVDPATAKGPSGVLLATSGTVTTLGDVLAIHYTAQAEL